MKTELFNVKHLLKKYPSSSSFLNSLLHAFAEAAGNVKNSNCIFIGQKNWFFAAAPKLPDVLYIYWPAVHGVKSDNITRWTMKVENLASTSARNLLKKS
jgi:hypothetical protein